MFNVRDLRFSQRCCWNSGFQIFKPSEQCKAVHRTRLLFLYCLTLKKSLLSFETSVSIYQTTRRNFPKEMYLHSIQLTSALDPLF